MRRIKRALFRSTLLREIGAVFAGLALLSALGLWVAVGHGDHLHHVNAKVLGVLTLLWVLLLAWGLWAVEFRVARPIRRIGEAAWRMRRGDFSLRAREEGLFDELRNVAAVFNSMAGRLHRTLSHLDIERAFSRTLLDRLPEGVAVVDTNMKVMFENRFFAGLFGGDAGLDRRLPLRELVPIPELEPLIERALRDRDAAHTVHVRLGPPQGGEPVCLKITARSIYPSALAPERALLVLEDETRELLALRQKQEWQDMLIHDVKSPLTSITASIKMLLDEGRVRQENVEFLRLAEQSAGKIMEILETYLEVLRMESGVLTARPERIRLDRLVQSAVEGVAAEAERKGIVISIKVAEGLEAEADRTMLYRMLVNLLDNAVKYSRRESKAGVFAERVEGGVRLEVWDRGFGIPEQDLPRIFERYYRVKQDARAKGTGLGLAFCKLAAELQGWDIGIRSKPGSGTVVSLLIKAAAGVRS